MGRSQKGGLVLQSRGVTDGEIDQVSLQHEKR